MIKSTLTRAKPKANEKSVYFSSAFNSALINTVSDVSSLHNVCFVATIPTTILASTEEIKPVIHGFMISV